jgi:hypothetical protein
VSYAIAEAEGWNSRLDEAFRAAVVAAMTPLALMECILLLEFYINKQWLANATARILGALPSAHFAIRQATFSSCALRIFALDRSMQYDKVVVPTRATRRADGEPQRKASEKKANRAEAGKRAYDAYTSKTAPRKSRASLVRLPS